MSDFEAVLTEITSEHTRWYAPAYEADTGNVIICGAQTVIREYADAQARHLDDMWQRTSPTSPRVFTAFMDKPEWQRLDAAEGVGRG